MSSNWIWSRISYRGSNSGWNETALLVLYRNRLFAALITILACCDELNNLLIFPFISTTFFWNNAGESVCIAQHLWRSQHSSTDHLHWLPHHETGDHHHRSISYTTDSRSWCKVLITLYHHTYYPRTSSLAQVALALALVLVLQYQDLLFSKNKFPNFHYCSYNCALELGKGSIPLRARP